MTLVERLRGEAAFQSKPYGVSQILYEAADAIEKAEGEAVTQAIVLSAFEERLEKAERLAEAAEGLLTAAHGGERRPVGELGQAIAAFRGADAPVSTVSDAQIARLVEAVLDLETCNLDHGADTPCVCGSHSWHRSADDHEPGCRELRAALLPFRGVALQNPMTTDDARTA